MTDKKAHDVGYKNPPQHTRFKKDKSGNPRGRPRKRKDLNTVLQRVLSRKVRIKDEDQRLPIREALIRRLRELALQGDRQALALQRRILTDAGYDKPGIEEFEERQRALDKAIENIRLSELVMEVEDAR